MDGRAPPHNSSGDHSSSESVDSSSLLDSSRASTAIKG